MIRSSGTIVHVHYQSGRLLGFVSGGEGQKLIYLKLLTNPFRLLWSLRAIALSGRKAFGIFEVLRYSLSSGFQAGGRDVGTELPRAELFTIAVTKDARGSGVAQSLYGSLVASFENRGNRKFKILVGAELGQAQKFYDRCGAQKVAETRVHSDKRSLLYVQDIADYDRTLES